MDRVFIEKYRVERTPQRFYEFMFTCAPFLEEEQEDEDNEIYKINS